MPTSAENELDPFQLFAAAEPTELKTYLATITSDLRFHAGTPVPVLGGFRNTPIGLLLPRSYSEPAPIDNVGVHLTGSEVFGRPFNSADLLGFIDAVDRRELLITCGLLIRQLYGRADSASELADRFAGALRSPHDVRARRLIRRGRALFVRETLLGIARLAIGRAAPGQSAMSADVAVGLLSLAFHDVLGTERSGEFQHSDGSFTTESVAWITAAQLSHGHADEASLLAFFENRWNDPARASSHSARQMFEDRVGYSLADQAAIAIALWGGGRGSNYVVFQRGWLDPLPVNATDIDSILANLSLDLAGAGHIDPPSNLRDIDIFERYPLIRISPDEYVLVEPLLILSRCLGWAPVYDIQDRKTQHQLANASEDYAMVILRRMYDQGPTGRVFGEHALKKLAGNGLKSADVAVDFGESWVVAEICARRIPRAVRHGDPASIPELFQLAIEELEQAAATCRQIQERPEGLTGLASPGQLRFFPIAVMTEGFPVNPLVLSEIRRILAERGTFAGVNAAAVEVIDLVELEMFEAIVEAGGPTVPELLAAKADSTFAHDSVRNFLLSRKDFQVVLSKRLESEFIVPLLRVASEMGVESTPSSST